MDKDMKGVVSLAQSIPEGTVIYGFPCAPKPRVKNVNDEPNMVSLSRLCSEVSQIPGFPSSYNLQEWTVSGLSLFLPRMKDKQVSMIDRYKRSEGVAKAMVSLATSCPKVALVPGFPSYPRPKTVCCEPNIITLQTLCPQISKIPGLPSVHVDMTLEWVTEMRSELKKLPNKFILNTQNDNRKKEENMFSCLPSCPEQSRVPGFPSLQRSKVFRPNIVNLLPLCPRVSATFGFSSVEGHKGEIWVTKMGLLMQRHRKEMQSRINKSPRSMEEQSNMFSLVPSCPGAARIPGFPSVPRYSMLSLLFVCPKESSLSGFASFRAASRWIFDPLVLCNKQSKKIIVETHSLNEDKDAMKTIFALAPACPESSKIHGFPSAPPNKSKIEHSMMSFILCCSRASNLKGFASMTTSSSTEWPNGTEMIVTGPQDRRPDMLMPLSGQNQLYCCNMKDMLKLVTACPKETTISGFPSAQVPNKSPNMVRLQTSTLHVSCLPGFPSAKVINADYINMLNSESQQRPIYQKLYSNRIVCIEKYQAIYTQDEMKWMSAIAPSCPLLAQTPGFPSNERLDPRKKEKVAISLPCSFEDTSQDLPDGQSPETNLKDEKVAGVTATSYSSSTTSIANGETYFVNDDVIYRFFFSFFHVFYCFALMTEDKFEGDTKQNEYFSMPKG